VVTFIFCGIDHESFAQGARQNQYGVRERRRNSRCNQSVIDAGIERSPYIRHYGNRLPPASVFVS
jgi:hypothetical protein